MVTCGAFHRWLVRACLAAGGLAAFGCAAAVVAPPGPPADLALLSPGTLCIAATDEEYRALNAASDTLSDAALVETLAGMVVECPDPLPPPREELLAGVGDFGKLFRRFGHLRRGGARQVTFAYDPLTKQVTGVCGDQRWSCSLLDALELIHARPKTQAKLVDVFIDSFRRKSLERNSFASVRDFRTDVVDPFLSLYPRDRRPTIPDAWVDAFLGAFVRRPEGTAGARFNPESPEFKRHLRAFLRVSRTLALPVRRTTESGAGRVYSTSDKLFLTIRNHTERKSFRRLIPQLSDAVSYKDRDLNWAYKDKKAIVLSIPPRQSLYLSSLLAEIATVSGKSTVWIRLGEKAPALVEEAIELTAKRISIDADQKEFLEDLWTHVHANNQTQLYKFVTDIDMTLLGPVLEVLRKVSLMTH